MTRPDCGSVTAETKLSIPRCTREVNQPDQRGGAPPGPLPRAPAPDGVVVVSNWESAVGPEPAAKGLGPAEPRC
jgi:hypothetical protein